MDVTIIIPCVRRSSFLEDVTIPAVKATTPSSVPLVIAEEPTMNVSECRQKYMDEASTRYVYFMDVDSVMECDGWLAVMMATMVEHNAGAVTMAEHWNGMDLRGDLFAQSGVVDNIRRVAGAGCLYDKSVGAYWDGYLGETYGYLGREFEDVDFGRCIEHLGRECLRTDDVYFNHQWHEQDDKTSDESWCWKMVTALLDIKWSMTCDIKRKEFFRLIHPRKSVKCERNHSLAVPMDVHEIMMEIYGDIVDYWGGDKTKCENPACCFELGHHAPKVTTPEERGVEDVWSKKYKAVKPRRYQKGE